MPIEVKTIQRVVPHKGLKINSEGVKKGSITDKALSLLTEPPKKQGVKTVYDLTKTRGETQIRLANGNSDVLEITSQQAGKNYQESLQPQKFMNPFELKSHIISVIKRFTGNYDNIPKTVV